MYSRAAPRLYTASLCCSRNIRNSGWQTQPKVSSIRWKGCTTMPNAPVAHPRGLFLLLAAEESRDALKRIATLALRPGLLQNALKRVLCRTLRYSAHVRNELRIGCRAANGERDSAACHSFHRDHACDLAALRRSGDQLEIELLRRRDESRADQRADAFDGAVDVVEMNAVGRHLERRIQVQDMGVIAGSDARKRGDARHLRTHVEAGHARVEQLHRSVYHQRAYRSGDVQPGLYGAALQRRSLGQHGPQRRQQGLDIVHWNAGRIEAHIQRRYFASGV